MTHDHSVLVTGATGTVGNEVIRALSDEGVPVRAMTRNPSRIKADIDANSGVTVRGDFDVPESLRQAAAGVEAVFLLAAPGPSVSRHDLAMLEAARAAGVRKVVKLSAIGTGSDTAGDNGPLRWHLPGERALQDSGMAWTVLRPASFASNALWWAQQVRSGEPIPNMTGTGVQGVIDPRDIAAVAVAALTTDKHDGKLYTLTGPEALSVADQVALLGEVLRKPLTTVDIPLEVAREQMLAAGMDAGTVAGAIAGYEILRTSQHGWLTEDVERILGRPPTSFRDWAVNHRAAFK